MAIIDVVKYNGTPGVYAWKYPSEELGTWTQLVVNESQEAILFKGGKALDAFGSGTHTLDTMNIPILRDFIKIPFGGKSPFTAEVWFINKLFSLDVKWGTATPIQIQDPKYGVFAPLRANGTFGIQIQDSKKFLTKLVGTIPVFDQTTLVKFFRGLYITKVKDGISQYVIHKQVSILELNAYLDELSEFMTEKIAPVLAEYGIKLVNFYINDISAPEDDMAVMQLKSALAKRAEMNILGYNYQQERSFDTMEGAAKNQGSGAAPIMGAGMGLGMGLGMGGSMGNAFGDMSKELRTDFENKPAKKCPKCQAAMDAEQRFCGICGYDIEKKEDSLPLNCSNCGAKISKDTKFCPECGNKYNPCPECGFDMDDDAVMCKRCGYEKPESCPKCHAALTGKVKFCPECGESLMQNCPKCGMQVGKNQKFCPECGEKLNP